MSHAVGTLSPKEAWAYLQEHPTAVLVDVRSTMEFLFVGHPVGAIHIPWLEGPDWEPNPQFISHVRQLLLGGAGGNAAVVLICRSGVRSLEAGKALLAAGVKQVFNVAEGFEGALDAQHHRSSVGGWRYHKLPWEQC